MIQLIRGFKDILPEEIPVWQQVEQTATALFEAFGFREIRIPVMERTELFARSIGEGTDIVEKEMYTFPDRKGDLLTLRPEATASVARAYIQHKRYAVDPVQKVYTIGPMFRRERPQKGRYRQFYQINAEAFGVASPLMDAQIIHMLAVLLDRLRVTAVTAHINSLGCPVCRPGYKAALCDHTAAGVDNLCADCKRRRTQNPLRVLDCKVPTCREAVAGAPSLLDHLCDACRDHFTTVTESLDLLGVSYEIDKQLVRGLDYYTRTTFELQTRSLGAQSAVAGGGRYDGLVAALGGPDTPAIGFAIGFDRLVEIMMQTQPPVRQAPDLFVAALGDESRKAAFSWSSALGARGIGTEMDLSGKSLKGLMKRADRLGARYVMIVGDAELAQQAVVLRDMETKTQQTLPIEGIVDRVAKQVRGKAADEPGRTAAESN